MPTEQGIRFLLEIKVALLEDGFSNQEANNILRDANKITPGVKIDGRLKMKGKAFVETVERLVNSGLY